TDEVLAQIARRSTPGKIVRVASLSDDVIARHLSETDSAPRLVLPEIASQMTTPPYTEEVLEQIAHRSGRIAAIEAAPLRDAAFTQQIHQSSLPLSTSTARSDAELLVLASTEDAHGAAPQEAANVPAYRISAPDAEPPAAVETAQAVEADTARLRFV